MYYKVNLFNKINMMMMIKKKNKMKNQSNRIKVLKLFFKMFFEKNFLMDLKKNLNRI